MSTEQSTYFVRGLIMRGAKIKTRTDSNETCQDLVPVDDISDDLRDEMKQILRKYRCKCQCTLTFRFLPIKYKQNRRAMVLFIVGCIVLAFTHVTVVIPNSPDNHATYWITLFHTLIWVALISSFFMA